MLLIFWFAFLIPPLLALNGHSIRTKMGTLKKVPQMPKELIRSRNTPDGNLRLSALRLPFGNIFSSQKVPRLKPGSEPHLTNSTSKEPVLTITSKTAWVNDFLINLRNKGKEHKLAKPKPTSEPHDNSKLKSKITSYQDFEAKDDLKGWTKLITSKDNSEVTSTHVQEVRMPIMPTFDRQAFIRYLVDTKGFNEADLSFLRTNLDYGFAEIDEELTKIRNLERNQLQECISIGGESMGSITCIDKLAFLGLIMLLW